MDDSLDNSPTVRDCHYRNSSLQVELHTCRRRLLLRVSHKVYEVMFDILLQYEKQINRQGWVISYFIVFQLMLDVLFIIWLVLK